MELELTPQQVELRDAARKLANEVFKDKAARWDRNEEYPEENKKLLCELGYLGLSIDEAYGGSGLGLVDTYLVIEEIAKVDLATALIVHEQNVSPRIVATCAPEALRSALMPKFISGELECSIAWTEPEAGSDGAAITTTATADGDGYLVNGQKVFTTYGDRADLHLVYARFEPSKGAKGVGTLLVRKDSPGLRVHKIPHKMGVRGASENELFFDNVRVPADHVVTHGSADSSRGFVQTLQVYNATRVGMGVMALGVAEGAFELARDYMLVRKQFGQRLADMQGLRWMMADMWIQIEAARSLCYRALAAVDAGRADPCLSSVAKVQATEMAQQVVLNCQQMFGGYGYFGLLPLERMLRDVRMLTITGGTTQTQKNAIANHIFPR
ncbi:acyl-CoA dehydrogenase family protein [Pseudorhodoferax sp.]|uniref:acyl-CoA dehydrogenase family protein n=1 Tax=Pseudorhodoferax sp. TaxID=1993553 RepID=UPI002DD665DB|nr:acyl-CoA dehydrogenase family protein [Pseudorhodoferax sp.]